MSVQSSSNAPDGRADEPVEHKVAEKFDPFHPNMPQIPGVKTSSKKVSAVTGRGKQRRLQIGGAATAVVLVIAVIVWWLGSRTRATAGTASETDIAEQVTPPAPVPKAPEAIRGRPIVAATLDEVSKPWATKKFTFVKPVTRENIDAMVVRIPGGALWAFSLQGPDGRCQLEFVSDLSTLASKYGYTASHPMVVSPCDKTVYDPLKIGSLGGSTWVRGEIVQGISLRPPISIDVKVTGRSVIADRIEQ